MLEKNEFKKNPKKMNLKKNQLSIIINGLQYNFR